jgi:transposase
MSDWFSELGARLVVGHKRDGRCVYDAQAKQELVLACRGSGVSISKVARECEINANQLSAWIRRHERGTAKAAAPIASAVQVTQPAFVPVAIEATKQEAAVTVDLQARLPNGGAHKERKILYLKHFQSKRWHEDMPSDMRAQSACRLKPSGPSPSCRLRRPPLPLAVAPPAAAP